MFPEAATERIQDLGTWKPLNSFWLSVRFTAVSESWSYLAFLFLYLVLSFAHRPKGKPEHPNLSSSQLQTGPLLRGHQKPLYPNKFAVDKLSGAVQSFNRMDGNFRIMP